MLYSNRLADEILGSYLQDPSLCVDEKYPLRADEFKVEFQKIIFITLHNLVAKGCKTIELIDVNEYLRPHEAQYNIYKDSDGDNYLKTISQIVDKGNFDYYYTEFRKFSCLQDFKDDHCDVSMFYDETKSEESQLKNLAQYTTEDIVNHFEKIAADKRKKYIPNIGSEEMICGSGWAEMVRRFKEEPMLGAGLCSPMLNSLYRGWVRGHLLLRGAPSSFGKAQPITTKIPTPNGMRRLGDIKVGDYVFDREGNPTKVLGVFPQGIIDCYKVEFRDGRETYCNNEHLWNIYIDHHKNKTKRVNKTLSEVVELMKKDTISIPVNKPVIYNTKDFNVDPYVIGSFLGNGCCKEMGLVLSSNDEEQVKNIATLLNATYKKNSDNNFSWTFYDLNGNRLHTEKVFTQIDGMCGYAHEKHIPNEYKYGDISQRYSLIQGLFDTDGSINKDGDVSYSTTSYQLALDVKEVLNSLGYFCNIHKENRKREVKHQCYILTVTLPSVEKSKLFRLNRKLTIALKYQNKIDRRDYNRLAFKKVTKVEPCEMVCIYVDNDEHLYLTNDYIVTHNTIYGISDLINCSCKRVWSDKENAFIENKSYQGKGAYIHTEQKMAEEIQPRFIATISGVPFHKILDGKFTPEEEERVIEAGRIAEESEIKIINYPTFTGSGLEQMIKDLSINGYEYIVFDYIWNNFYIMGELKEINGGGAIREDQALLHIADVLKLSAEKYNVGIATMIQLNGKEKEVEVVDEGCLFGSKSVKTKLDNGSIFMSPRKKELKQVETLIDKWNFENNKGFNHKIIPNGVSHCFKTRYSRYGQNIKIWHYLDKGTGKMTDMFATTADNMYIDIPKLYIENTKGGSNE